MCMKYNKMPLVLISVDGANKALHEFKEIPFLVVDFMIESTDPRSKAIGDELCASITVIQRIALEKLNDRREEDTDIDVQARIMAAVSMIRQMKVRNAVIISHDSVFNSCEETRADGEWEVIGC